MHWTESYFEQAYLKRWELGPPSTTTRAEAAHLLALLSARREVPLLDVACGHGRHAVPIASLGFRGVGLDGSRALLNLAAHHTAGASASPQWVRGDMRSLPFASSFGGAVLLDSFGFFDRDDENALVLRELRRVLLPGGRAVVAVANGTPILANFRSSDSERRGSVVLERQRLYSGAELTALLEAVGFAVRVVFADYTGGGFDEGASAKVVILAEAAAVQSLR